MCESCSVRFNSRCALKRHRMMRHSGQCKFVCHTCGRKYYERDAYIGHVNKHVGAKPYACNLCKAAFGYKSSLRRHLNTCPNKTDKWEHKCDTYGAVLSSRTVLLDHIQGKNGCTDTSCPVMQSCQSEKGNIVCKVEGCTHASLTNGYTLGTQSYLGDKRVYACDSDYILIGNGATVCMQDGWSGKEPSCYEYLVSGPNGVPDSKLSASSVLDSHHHGMSSYFSPKFSRLNTEFNQVSGTGSWVARTQDQNQFIQVKFANTKTVVGVALRGRSNPLTADYVTLFKVGYSDSCSSWSIVTDEDGADKEFSGNTDKNTVVIRVLPVEIQALCVRIYPVDWHNSIALRFDVIGRSPSSSA